VQTSRKGLLSLSQRSLRLCVEYPFSESLLDRIRNEFESPSTAFLAFIFKLDLDFN